MGMKELNMFTFVSALGSHSIRRWWRAGSAACAYLRPV